MKVVFLGVGEAYDENLVNNSHIVFAKKKLLLDCGYSVPRSLWKNYPDQNFLDMVFLSHAHLDHYMGVPILLARMQDEKRTNPLQIICEASTRASLAQLITYAHGNLSGKITFPVEFVEVSETTRLEVGNLRLTFARTRHTISNLAIRIQTPQGVLCYSGDGDFTEQSTNLYRGADLLIHEGFTLERVKNGHASIRDVIEKCNTLEIKNLALTHLNRTLRREHLNEVRDFIDSYPKNMNIFIPQPLDEFTF